MKTFSFFFSRRRRCNPYNRRNRHFSPNPPLLAYRPPILLERSPRSARFSPDFSSHAPSRARFAEYNKIRTYFPLAVLPFFRSVAVRRESAERSRATFATLAAVSLRILSNSFASVFQKRLAGRGRRPFFVNAATFALLTFACVGPAFAVDWTRFEPSFWRDVVVSGVLCATGNACLVAALGRGELSILGPINAWKAVVGLTFGFFLLGEAPTFPALFGVFLIGVGSYFVLDASPERFSFRLLFKNSAIRLRVAALILTALEAIFIKKIVLATGPAPAFFLWSATGAFFSTLSLGVATLIPLISTRLRQSPQTLPTTPTSAPPQTAQTTPTSAPLQTAQTTPTLRFSVRDAFELAATAACVGTMQLSTNVAFERLDVGLALALFQLSAPLNVLLGWRLFRERGVVKKLLGATVAVGGAACVVLFG